MNKIVNTFLLAGDRFMPEMHLRQSAVLGKHELTHSAYELFTKKRNMSNQELAKGLHKPIITKFEV